MRAGDKKQGIYKAWPNDVVPAVVVECNYFSKLSFDCNYYYVTAKATVKLSESNTIKHRRRKEVLFGGGGR